MLEPLALPLLLKSIDFMYSEYSKLLDERRKRREEVRGQSEEKKEVALVDPPALKPNIKSKDDALKAPVDPVLWQQDEKEIEHLVSLLEIHYGNYYLLKKQYAQWTAALVPPVIANGLAHEERQIEETTQALRKLISKIYVTDAEVGSLLE